MGKTLKVCLAMGGGVSLGAFSGAALTEALKLLILFGKDENGVSYEKVVVDGFSGASAGAMSLALMLRCLVDSKSVCEQHAEIFDKIDLEDKLIKTYGQEIIEGLGTEKKDQLLALEVAQVIQKECWVNKISGEKLLPIAKKLSTQSDPHSSIGLLDRKPVERIAKDFLIQGIEGINLENRQVLDSRRVIFASSLTNMTPLTIRDSDNEKSDSELVKNLQLATNSYNHKELRIIDLQFDNEKIDSDKRWLKFCSRDISENDPLEFKLRSKESWAILASTVMACGAFPIAFEPVLLKRYKEEYAEAWPKKFNESFHNIAPLSKIDQKSIFNKDDTLNYSSFNFPYMDGGTFNNEPIKEAFRIAHFIDYHDDPIKTKSQEYDRLVIFVDPIVSQSETGYRMQSFSAIKSSDFRAKLNSEGAKFVDNVSSIISLLQNQGSVKEEQKINEFLNSIDLTHSLRNYFDEVRIKGENVSIRLIATTLKKIDQTLNDRHISLGTRDPDVYYFNELKKQCSKREGFKCANLSPAKIKKFIDFLLNKETQENNIEVTKLKKDDKGQTVPNPPDYKEFLNYCEKHLQLDKKDDLAEIELIVKTFFIILAEISLNSEGKDEKAQRVAITPIDMTSKKIIKLPGSEIAAFGGFAMRAAREYAFLYGRLSTLKSLSSNDFRKYRQEKLNVEQKKLDPPTSFIVKLVDQDDESTTTDYLDNIVKKNLKNEINEIEFYKKVDEYVKKLNQKLLFPLFKRIINLMDLPKWILLLGCFAVLGGMLFPAIFPDLGFWSVLITIISVVFGVSILAVGNEIVGILNSISAAATHTKLSGITLSIISDKRISRRIRLNFKNGEKRSIKMKELRNGEGYQYLYELHLIDKETHSNDQQKGLTKERKLPRFSLYSTASLKRSPVDTFLIEELQKRRNEEEAQSLIIASISVKPKFAPWTSRIDLPALDIINNESNSIYHSLSILKYHLNPMLEVDLSHLESERDWYFKESTMALYKTLLKSVSNANEN